MRMELRVLANIIILIQLSLGVSVGCALESFIFLAYTSLETQCSVEFLDTNDRELTFRSNFCDYSAIPGR